MSNPIPKETKNLREASSEVNATHPRTTLSPIPLAQAGVSDSLRSLASNAASNNSTSRHSQRVASPTISNISAVAPMFQLSLMRLPSEPPNRMSVHEIEHLAARGLHATRTPSRSLERPGEAQTYTIPLNLDSVGKKRYQITPAGKRGLLRVHTSEDEAEGLMIDKSEDEYDDEPVAIALSPVVSPHRSANVEIRKRSGKHTPLSRFSIEQRFHRAPLPEHPRYKPFSSPYLPSPQDPDSESARERFGAADLDSVRADRDTSAGAFANQDPPPADFPQASKPVSGATDLPRVAALAAATPLPRGVSPSPRSADVSALLSRINETINSIKHRDQALGLVVRQTGIRLSHSPVVTRGEFGCVSEGSNSAHGSPHLATFSLETGLTGSLRYQGGGGEGLGLGLGENYAPVPIEPANRTLTAGDFWSYAKGRGRNGVDPKKAVSNGTDLILPSLGESAPTLSREWTEGAVSAKGNVAVPQVVGCVGVSDSTPRVQRVEGPSSASLEVGTSTSEKTERRLLKGASPLFHATHILDTNILETTTTLVPSPHIGESASQSMGVEAPQTRSRPDETPPIDPQGITTHSTLLRLNRRDGAALISPVRRTSGRTGDRYYDIQAARFSSRQWSNLQRFINSIHREGAGLSANCFDAALTERAHHRLPVPGVDERAAFVAEELLELGYYPEFPPRMVDHLYERVTFLERYLRFKRKRGGGAEEPAKRQRRR